MSMYARIRGLAVPFDRPRLWHGCTRAIDSHAFDEWLATSPRPRILWESHDDAAPVLGRAATVFAVAGVGLFFEIEIEFEYGDWGFSAFRLAHRGKAQASIGPQHPWSVRAGARKGIDCEVVTKASLDHITVLSDAVFGEMAPVWVAPADAADLVALSWRRQEANAQFDAGLEAHQAARRAASAAAARRRSQAKAREEDRRLAREVAAWAPHIEGTPLARLSPQVQALTLRGLRPPRAAR